MLIGALVQSTSRSEVSRVELRVFGCPRGLELFGRGWLRSGEVTKSSSKERNIENRRIAMDGHVVLEAFSFGPFCVVPCARLLEW